MDQNIKHQIVQSVNSIKNKLKHMRDTEDQTHLRLNRILKPVTEPLKALVSNPASVNKDKKLFNGTNNNNNNNLLYYSPVKNKDNQSKNHKSDNDKISNVLKSPEYSKDNEDKTDSIYELNQADVSLQKDDIIDIYDSMDIPFGIRKDQDNNIMIGDSMVRFSKIENADGDKTIMINVGGRSYELTPGLKELLLRKKPNLSLILETDKLVYGDILHHTNVHKRDYNAHGQIKGDKGVKYREIIKPLLSDSKSSKQGGKLPTLKKYKSNIDLVYWDDPNELVDRLKLLIASKNAGNTNHDNEIISIVEELKEAGIIKE